MPALEDEQNEFILIVVTMTVSLAISEILSFKEWPVKSGFGVVQGH